MSTTIFIVMANFDQEASSPVLSFRERPHAVAFSDRCRAYDRTVPLAPTIVPGSAESDSAWAEYDRTKELWNHGHPAGADNVHADSYEVRALPLLEVLP